MNSYITVKLSLDFWYIVPLCKTRYQKSRFLNNYLNNEN